MSLQELPGLFGVLFPAFSPPLKAERSRNKERLEASLAGLCELDLLKQRQECRVLSALCLGDSGPGRPSWGALRSARCALDTPQGKAPDESSHRIQTSSLQYMPWGQKASLEHQVAELKLSTEVQSEDTPTNNEDSPFSSGDVLVAKQNRSPESGYHPVVPLSLSVPEKTETGETWLSDPARQARVNNASEEMRDVDPSRENYQQAQKVETYMFELIQRRTLTTRPSKPRTSLAHDARAVSVVRQSSFCHEEDQHSPKQVSVEEIISSSQCFEGTAPKAIHNLDQEHHKGTWFTEDSPPSYQHHLQQSDQHQPVLYHRPREISMINTSHPPLLEYQSFRVLHVHPDTSNSEPDSPQQFQSYPFCLPHQLNPSDEQLVSAEYIPAQPCRASTRAYAYHHSNPQKGPGVPKPNRNICSPARGHHHQEQQPTTSQIQPSRSRGGTKKCRLNEDKSGASRKPGKKACRSQSENSLQRVPERKYNTVERDGAGSGSNGRGSRSSHSRSKKQQQGGGSYRRWQSTLELSQDDADQPPMHAPMQRSSVSNYKDHCGRRTRKSRPIHVSYAYTHHHCYQFERDQVPLCQPSEDYPQLGQGESESSMSEADSPDSSSLSSDSDESGGLVWPQQLPPQLSLPSPSAPSLAPLQSKAFVKIKASHALKKKILRFRTGSLKVMTTV